MNAAGAGILAVYSSWVCCKQLSLEGEAVPLLLAGSRAGTLRTAGTVSLQGAALESPIGPARPESFGCTCVCNTLYRGFLERSFQRTEGTGLTPPGRCQANLASSSSILLLQISYQFGQSRASRACSRALRSGDP